MITPTQTRRTFRPLGDPQAGQQGKLVLAFARRSGRTALVRRYTSAPFGSVRASYSDGTGMPEVQITNPAGGVLGGDRLDIRISVEPEAAATVLTQGATKAYRGPESSQHAAFKVGEEAFLEHLPHHLIPYAGAGHRLRTEFHLTRSSTLIAWEALSAGRVAGGERFAFERLSSRTRLLVDGRPQAVDGFELVGAKEHFGGYCYLGTLFVAAPEQLQELADGMHEAFSLVPRALASASAPGFGVCVVRVLAPSAEALYSALNLARAEARGFLDLPAAPRRVR